MKTIRYLLLLTMLAVIGFTADATRYFTVGEIQYSTADDYNGLCTAYKYVGASNSVTVPTSVINPDDNMRYRVAQIGYQFAYGNTTLTSVTVRWGVSTILNYAFANCTKLRTVILPSSCTEWYQHIFEGCSSLQYVAFAGTTLPEQTFTTNFPGTKCKLYLPTTSSVTYA